MKKYALADVELERRGGYTWYVSDPLSILNSAYPMWVAKWSIGRNVLAGTTDGGTPTDASSPPDAGSSPAADAGSPASDGSGADTDPDGP